MGEKMRKALAMLLCVFMMFELVACGSSGKAKTPDITYSYSEAKDGTITLTLSDDYEKLRNQEGCDKAKKMYGYKDVKYNEDTKSVTYTLTPEQHTAMLRMNAYNMLMIFSAMPGSDTYKNITNIQPNSELSEFVITTKSQTLTKEEKNLFNFFYKYGSIYGLYRGVRPVDVVVRFENSGSGKVIEERHSESDSGWPGLDH
jgi:hypothetical protein